LNDGYKRQSSGFAASLTPLLMTAISVPPRCRGYSAAGSAIDFQRGAAAPVPPAYLKGGGRSTRTWTLSFINKKYSETQTGQKIFQKTLANYSG
jgi:hypothetical protein